MPVSDGLVRVDRFGARRSLTGGRHSVIAIPLSFTPFSDMDYSYTLSRIRSLSRRSFALAFTIVSIGVKSVLSANLAQDQAIEWSSPTPAEVLVIGSVNRLQAFASSGLPVTFRVVEGPASLEFSNDPGSGNRFPYVSATNVGPITVVAEQVGGTKDGRSYLAASVQRTFNRALVVEQLVGEDVMRWGEYGNSWPIFGPNAYSVINHLFLDQTNTYFAMSGNGGLWVRNSSGLHSRVRQPAAPIQDVVIDHDIAYAAVGTRGISLVDLTRQDEPKLLAEYGLEGDATQLKLKGKFAYVVVGANGVRIVDVSLPNAPALRGSLTNGGRAVRVDISGKLAYVATDTPNTDGSSQGGLQVYDIGNASVPVHLTSYPAKGSITALTVEGSRVFLADSLGGLQLIEMRNPLAPVVMGRWEVPSCTDIAVSSGYAYLACGRDGVFLLDLQNLDTFNFGLRFNLTEKRPWPGGWFAGVSGVDTIKAVGGLLFLARANLFYVVHMSGGRPQQLTIDLPSSVDLAELILGFRAVSSSGLPVAVKVKSGPAVIDGDRLVLKDVGTVLLELSQSGNPNYASVSEERTLKITSSKQRQTISWVGPSETNLYPRRPYPLRAASSSGLPVTFRVQSGPAYLSDGSLYVTGAGSIAVLAEQSGDDQFERTSLVQTFSGSQLMFASDHPAARLGAKAVKVVLQGNLAFVTKENSEISIIDVSNPKNPRIITTQPIGRTRDFSVDTSSFLLGDKCVVFNDINLLNSIQGEVQWIQLKDNLIYIAYKNAPFAILDLAGREPVVKSKIDIRPLIFDVVEDKIYALSEENQNTELVVIDVSDPGTPRKIGSLSQQIGFNYFGPKSICVSESKVYFSATMDLNGGGGVVQIDVSNPTRPTVEQVFRVGQWNTLAGGVQVVGNLLYLAHRAGVTVFDLKAPQTSSAVARYQTVGTPTDLKVSQDFVYVADAEGGLQIVSLDPMVLRYPGFSQADRFGFSMTRTSRSKVLIESSSDLKTWDTEAYWNKLPSPDISLATGGDSRYYRASRIPDGFVWVQPGSFLMGSPPVELERGNDELQHEVTLTRGFWMAEHEVTRGEYDSVMDLTSDFIMYNGLSKNCTWEEAVNYCIKLTKQHRREGKITNQQVYRLPTEAEWEFCARAGTTGPRYSETNRFGARWKDLRNTSSLSLDGKDGNLRGDINPWGLHDMLTGMSEWCSDWYSDYPAGPQTDPAGPESGTRRVIRGFGDFDRWWTEDFGIPQTFRSAQRVRISGEAGFRVVLSSEPSVAEP